MQPEQGNLPKGATMHIAETHAQPARACINLCWQLRLDTSNMKTRRAAAGITEMASKTAPAQLLTNTPIRAMTFNVTYATNSEPV